MIFECNLRVPFAVSRHQPQWGPASWRQDAQLRYFSRPCVSWAGGRHSDPGCSPWRLGRRTTRSRSNGGGSMVISDSWTVPTLLLSTASSLDNNYYCTTQPQLKLGRALLSKKFIKKKYMKWNFGVLFLERFNDSDSDLSAPTQQSNSIVTLEYSVIFRIQ